jgi:hypothetical protein
LVAEAVAPLVIIMTVLAAVLVVIDLIGEKINEMAK